jgi:hypothetical protein
VTWNIHVLMQIQCKCNVRQNEGEEKREEDETYVEEGERANKGRRHVVS